MQFVSRQVEFSSSKRTHRQTKKIPGGGCLAPQVLRQETKQQQARFENNSLLQGKKEGAEHKKTHELATERGGGGGEAGGEEDAKVQLILPEGRGVNGVCRRFQDAGVISLQVFAADFNGHLVVVAELKEEVHGGVAAAGDGGLVAHHPVFPSGICRQGKSGGLAAERSHTRREVGQHVMSLRGPPRSTGHVKPAVPCPLGRTWTGQNLGQPCTLPSAKCPRYTFACQYHAHVLVSGTLFAAVAIPGCS